jgi:hypothetical protein
VWNVKRVSTEMSLHVLAYNLKRVIAIIGVGPLLQAIRAWDRHQLDGSPRRRRMVDPPSSANAFFYGLDPFRTFGRGA